VAWSLNLKLYCSRQGQLSRYKRYLLDQERKARPPGYGASLTPANSGLQGERGMEGAGNRGREVLFL